MRILCRHGHFALYQSYAGELARFMEFWDIGGDLVPEREFYTFALFKDAPQYSIAGRPYLGLPAVKTFAGEPWEILKANGFVYNIALKSLVPKEAITYPIELKQTGYYYLDDRPFIQPGSLVEGRRILSYDAAYDDDEFISAKVSVVADE